MEILIEDPDVHVRRESGPHRISGDQTLTVTTIGRYASLPRRLESLTSVAERFDIYHSDDIYYSGYGLDGNDLVYGLGGAASQVEKDADQYHYDPESATIRNLTRHWRG